MKNKRLLYLTVFIIGVSILSILSVIIYEKIYSDNKIPLDIDISLDNSEKIQIQGINVYDFVVKYHEDSQKWTLSLMLENTTDKDINIEDNYQIVLYDTNNVILKIINDKFMGIIKAHEEMLIGLVLDLDGSLINRVSINKE